MAKKEVKEKAIEVALWESANKLRGNVESAEYKQVVLGSIFLKFASDKFEEHRIKLITGGKDKYIEFIDLDTEMKRIQKDFKVLLEDEKQSQNQLINAYKTLGYDIEL